MPSVLPGLSGITPIQQGNNNTNKPVITVFSKDAVRRATGAAGCIPLNDLVNLQASRRSKLTYPIAYPQF